MTIAFIPANAGVLLTNLQLVLKASITMNPWMTHSIHGQIIAPINCYCVLLRQNAYTPSLYAQLSDHPVTNRKFLLFAASFCLLLTSPQAQ